MKTVCIMVLVAGTLAAAPSDFAGTWKVRYAGAPNTGPKTIGSMIFDFQIDGRRVSGLARIGPWPGDAPIADGRVDGDQISFTATGHLTSTTGIPTFRLEGTLSGGELVIRLSGSGGVYEYKGGRLDADAARSTKIDALQHLSTRPWHSTMFGDSGQGEALAAPGEEPSLTGGRRELATLLASDVADWEKAKMKPETAEARAAALSAQELDDLVAFYNSPFGRWFLRQNSADAGKSVAAFVSGK